MPALATATQTATQSATQAATANEGGGRGGGGLRAYGEATFGALGTMATVLTADPAAADDAHAILASELSAIDLTCSRFRPDSELAQLNAAPGRRVRISPLLANA